jgi:hypothetical protein
MEYQFGKRNQTLKDSIESEYKNGVNIETNLFPIIQSYFHTSSLEKLSVYHPFDFKSSTCYFEIKSRRTKLNDYENTIIGLNKIQFAETNYKVGLKFYFIFHFSDGIYYYKYEQNDINILKQVRITRKDRQQYQVGVKTYCKIDNKDLIKME